MMGSLVQPFAIGLYDATVQAGASPFIRDHGSRARSCRQSLRKPAVRAALRGFVLIDYRVSVWTHTKTSPAFRFCRFPIRVAVAVEWMTRGSGSSRKVVAMA